MSCESLVVKAVLESNASTSCYLAKQLPTPPQGVTKGMACEPISGAEPLGLELRQHRFYRTRLGMSAVDRRSSRLPDAGEAPLADVQPAARRANRCGCRPLAERVLRQQARRAPRREFCADCMCRGVGECAGGLRTAMDLSRHSWAAHCLAGRRDGRARIWPPARRHVYRAPAWRPVHLPLPNRDRPLPNPQDSSTCPAPGRY